MNKLKIALIIDIRNWAFDNIANNLINYLSDTFIFHKFYVEDYLPNNLDKLYIDIFLKNKFDLVHFFWRIQILDISSYKLKKVKELDYFNLKKNLINTKITTTIYDHAFLNEKNFFFYNINKIILKYFYDEISVCSKKLLNIYNKKIDKKIFLTPDGVDLEIFKPINKKNIEKQEITLGWVGNSQWKEFKNEDVKGVHTIIIPAYKKLKKILKTKKINLKILDRNLERKILTKKEMNEWFNNIDIYINASLHEGTPNPVLEAMAVGIPIISTDVGIVSEVFGFHQKKFIFKRDIDELVKKLIMLINNPSIYNLISKENLYSIKKFDIKKTILKYKNFFTNTMNKKENILEKSINHMIFEEKLYSLEKIILSKRMKFNFSLFNKLKIGILITKAKNFYDFS